MESGVSAPSKSGHCSSSKLPLQGRHHLLGYYTPDHAGRWRPTPNSKEQRKPLRNRGATHTPPAGGEHRKPKGRLHHDTRWEIWSLFSILPVRLDAHPTVLKSQVSKTRANQEPRQQGPSETEAKQKQNRKPKPCQDIHRRRLFADFLIVAEGTHCSHMEFKSRCPKPVVELHLYHRRRLGRLCWTRSGSLLILFPSFPEAFQAPPALRARDICDGPVELLGQRFVRVLGPVVRFQAAKLLVIFLCPGTRCFRGSSWVAGIGMSMSRRFRKGFRRGYQASAGRDRSWSWSTRRWTCWRFRRVHLLGGCSAASLSLNSTLIGLTLIHYQTRNIGLLEARLTNVIVHHGALRT